MPTAQQPVPIEVVEAIIDHLHNDKTSLAACCLVSSAWLPSSRLHLIPSVTIHNKNYNKLLALLHEPKSRLAFWVSQLRLIAHSGDAGFTSCIKTRNAWLNEALPTLAKHFSSVRSLALREITWETLTLQSQNTLLNAFPKVEEVDVYCCRFPGLRQHAEFLSSFKSAKFIITLGCNYAAEGENPHLYPYLKISSSVRKFVTEAQQPTFIAWLGAQNSDKLEDISINFISAPIPIAFQQVVSHAGSSLRRLQVGFVPNWMKSRTSLDKLLRLPGYLIYFLIAIDRPIFNLSDNTSLEELKMNIVLFSYQTNISSLFTLLSSVSSPNLRHIEIRLYFSFEVERLSELPWAKIDDLAAERIWGLSLERLIIVLTPPIFFSRSQEEFLQIAEQIIYPELSRIAKRSLLDVRYCKV